jgi:hypothetical protein
MLLLHLKESSKSICFEKKILFNNFSAILTPYLSLRTFRMALPGLRPLDYTNANIYTGELLDAYMEYRFVLNHLRSRKLEIVKAYFYANHS